MEQKLKGISAPFSPGSGGAGSTRRGRSSPRSCTSRRSTEVHSPAGGPSIHPTSPARPALSPKGINWARADSPGAASGAQQKVRAQQKPATLIQQQNERSLNLNRENMKKRVLQRFSDQSKWLEHGPKRRRRRADHGKEGPQDPKQNATWREE